MFAREKKNKSGTTSVVVVEKIGQNQYKHVKTIGCSSDPDELVILRKKADRWIDQYKNGLSIFDYDEDAMRYDRIFSQLKQEQIVLKGPELIYGTLFDNIGYNKIETSDMLLFRALIITRLYHPGSKLRTADYLRRFMHKEYSVDKIYRFLDKLCIRKKKRLEGHSDDVKWQVEQISFNHTKEVLGGNISVVFYDTTTLYFESREDDIRVPGYSKDGKNANPQIVLGLLVGAGGNPIGYEIHKGNQYEGTTLIPIIKKLEKRFNLSKPTVIADAGLLNKKNIEELEQEDYEYIIGARIKSLKKAYKKQILDLNLNNGDAVSIELDGKRYVISMSDKRAVKNAKDRKKGVERLRKRFASGVITKGSVNNRGYNRFLTLEGETSVIIDQKKIEEDEQFDGLKGYITNSTLPDADVIDNYHYLFMIERAFRFNKSDLDIRPMYHRLINRIEAHICICFTAYTIMLELERKLKGAGSQITLHRAMFLAEGIYELHYINPYNNKEMAVLLKTENDEEVSELLEIIGGSQYQV